MEENVEDVPKIVAEVIKKAFKFLVKIRQQGINLYLSEGFGYLEPLEKAVRNFHFF